VIFSEKAYIQCDPFDGERDVNIRAKTVKVVKVRKEHLCVAGLHGRKGHIIKKGESARLEKAIVDGVWGSFYCCIPCMDKLIAEFDGEGAA
jgi:hypothetical protein